MRNTPISSVAAGAAPGGCTLESELLNSERIGERFGGCSIEVLEQGPRIRRSSLFSVENGVRTCRSYAVVQFIEQEAADVADAQQKILAGQSIGATLKAAGWNIRKVTRHVGSAVPPDGHIVPRIMCLDDRVSLAMHAYRLILEQGDRSVHYATIIEVHHPEYLGEAALQKLYSWSDDDRLPDDVVAELVDRVWTETA